VATDRFVLGSIDAIVVSTTVFGQDTVVDSAVIVFNVRIKGARYRG
jgi:hypothetical protein